MWKRFWWLFLLSVPLGAALGFVITVGVLNQLPKIYESKTVIQVSPIAGDKEGMPHSVRYLSRHLELIQSSDMIRGAILEVGLLDLWSCEMQEAEVRYKSSITVSPIRETDLILIKTRDPNREIAAHMAQGLVKAYSKNLIDLSNEYRESQLKALTQAVREQEEKVHLIREKMNALTQQ